MQNNLSALPPLRISDAKKTQSWAKKCLDAVDTAGIFSNSQLRSSYIGKLTNYNLFNNVLDRKDMERIINPHGLELDAFPDDPRHIGLGNGMIRTLIGEHSKRRFDWRVIISSKDDKGISSKEEEKMEIIRDQVTELIMSEAISEEEIQKKLQNTQDYLTYSWQDLREQTANKILKYYYQQQGLANQFNDNFLDFLISGECISVIETLRGDVYVRKGSPLNFYTVNGPQARTYDECDIIVEYGYKQPGEIIDDFGDELTPTEIDRIINGGELNKGVAGPITSQNMDLSSDGRYGIGVPNHDEVNAFGGMYRQDGSIRVMKGWWRAYRKLGVMTYIDDDGIEQTRFVDEKYIPNETEGEYIEKYIWVTDWWEGYKIGGDIYTNAKPVDSQTGSFTNPSKSTPPVIGTIAATNTNKAQAFMDICKPFDYHYNIYYYQRELLTASNLGTVLAFPISMKPANMSMQEWMHYIQITKMMPLDPTAEIQKGPSQGQAAGQFNSTQAQVLNFNQGQLIQQITMMMESVKNDMYVTTGVLPGRIGMTSPNESATGVNNQVQSSVNSTEIWFNYIDHHKRRVLEKLLDTSKIVLKNNPVKAQFILDDYGIAMLESFDEFCESEYDLHISNSGKETEIFNKLEMLFHAAMQTGQAKLSHIAQMYLNDSTQVALRKLQSAEEQNEKNAQASQQAAEETKRSIAAQNAEIEMIKLELEQKKLELEKYKIDQDNATRIQVATLNSYIGMQDNDLDNDGIPDPLEMEKLYRKDREIESKRADKQLELNTKADMEREKLRIQKEIKDKEIKRDYDNMKNDKEIAQINSRNRANKSSKTKK